jgi:hypothetical protein
MESLKDKTSKKNIIIVLFIIMLILLITLVASRIHSNEPVVITDNESIVNTTSITNTTDTINITNTTVEEVELGELILNDSINE